ncbi:putative serine/threonine-protein kinase [Dorcoceras hygrometricum]|uniref:Putative serine/threonine-protein kinase n=1 Tax=Dorcoceras hygrometricum TaxID=472368 RepID=A0A2Z7C3Q2_9LAMI|nr:putative serine/threonine-protein kinase [Dorcoceras hygrometricum]
MLATGFPNDWLDQTMSYQLIQTISFAMHPRLVNYITVALVWMYCSCLMVITIANAPAELSSSANCDDITADVIIAVRSFLFTSTTACATADLSSSANYDDVTDYIFIDGPLRCSIWFPFDVPAGPPSSSSTCSWFLSFQLVHYAPAGSTWPPPDYEQLTQLWTSPLLIQLPFTMINQTNC